MPEYPISGKYSNHQNNKNELRLMIKVTKLYYQEGYSQKEISREVGLSTSKISILINKAIKNGYLEFNIFDPFYSLTFLEDKLKKEFNFDYVNVVSGPFQNNEVLISKLGLHAALYVRRLFRTNDIIGISGGSTLYAMATSMVFDTFTPARIIPIIGGVNSEHYNYTSNGIAAILANQLGEEYSQVPFPSFVEKKETCSAIMNDASVKEVFNLANKADTIILGIGTASSRMLSLPHIKEEEIRKAEKKGVVAEIGGYFLNKKGEIVETDFQDRLIGIPLDDIKKSSNVIAVGGGKEKKTALKACALSGIINKLIIDEPTARSLI